MAQTLNLADHFHQDCAMFWK